MGQPSRLHTRNTLANLKYYRKLISLRKQTPCLTNGSYKSIYKKRGIYVYQRSYESQTYQIAVNMTSKFKRLKLKTKGDIIMSNYAKESFSRLKPYEAIIMEIKNEKS